MTRLASIYDGVGPSGQIPPYDAPLSERYPGATSEEIDELIREEEEFILQYTEKGEYPPLKIF